MFYWGELAMARVKGPLNKSGVIKDRFELSHLDVAKERKVSKPMKALQTRATLWLIV